MRGVGRNAWRQLEVIEVTQVKCVGGLGYRDKSGDGCNSRQSGVESMRCMNGLGIRYDRLEKAKDQK